MKELLNDIKSKNMKSVYVFYGEERYLKKLYENKLKSAVIEPGAEMMNVGIFEGNKASVYDAVNAINTLPFMSEKRLIIWRDSRLFASGRKDDSEEMAKAILTIPSSTTIIFIEDEIDKRLKITKDTTKTGRLVEFKTPTEKELIDWVGRTLKASGKAITVQDAMFLLRTVAHDMSTVEAEINKLVTYTGERNTITAEDISAICTKAPLIKIFDMIDAIGNKKTEVALDIFNNLIVLKESPIMIIAMIGRQFRLIMEAKLLRESGLSATAIAETMGQRQFLVNECLNQGRYFDKVQLRQALSDCLNADLNIKTGKMDDKLAVELLILKYSG